MHCYSLIQCTHKSWPHARSFRCIHYMISSPPPHTLLTFAKSLIRSSSLSFFEARGLFSIPVILFLRMWVDFLNWLNGNAHGQNLFLSHCWKWAAHFRPLILSILFYLPDSSRLVDYSSLHIVRLCHLSPTVYWHKLPKLDCGRRNGQLLVGYIVEHVAGAAEPN